MDQSITITGIVRNGQHRGKSLGFPTLNIALEQKIEEGIYISQTKIEKTIYNSLTFIGEAKTFHETRYQSETYLFDFAKDIYGQAVAVSLIKKIRDNQAFDSEEALVKAMEGDKKQAEDYFSNPLSVKGFVTK